MFIVLLHKASACLNQYCDNENIAMKSTEKTLFWTKTLKLPHKFYMQAVYEIAHVPLSTKNLGQYLCYYQV